MKTQAYSGRLNAYGTMVKELKLDLGVMESSLACVMFKLRSEE